MTKEEAIKLWRTHLEVFEDLIKENERDITDAMDAVRSDSDDFHDAKLLAEAGHCIEEAKKTAQVAKWKIEELEGRIR